MEQSVFRKPLEVVLHCFDQSKKWPERPAVAKSLKCDLIKLMFKFKCTELFEL